MKTNDNMATFNFLDAVLSIFVVFAMKICIHSNVRAGEADDGQQTGQAQPKSARLATFDLPELQRNKKLNYDTFDTFSSVIFGTIAPAILVVVDSDGTCN